MTDDDVRDWITAILTTDKGKGMFLTPADNARPLHFDLLLDAIQHSHEATPFYVRPEELAALRRWWMQVQLDSEFRRMSKAHLN